MHPQHEFKISFGSASIRFVVTANILKQTHNRHFIGHLWVWKVAHMCSV